jgi:hypothetical protein
MSHTQPARKFGGGKVVGRRLAVEFLEPIMLLIEYYDGGRYC